ncbi:GatB/YqeY domain-containing protein [Candidatus Wolfebacteria bacterium]|nr:GatB/YqeY domain-containing protein [Candidatus Wolfebacteria bacterium]
MLLHKIKEDLKNALKTGDGFTAGVLRFILSVIHNKEIEKRSGGKEPTLSEEETIGVLMKEVKKRKEAAEIFSKGGREDLASKEIKESEIIQKYLPEQLSEEEIVKIVAAAIERIGAKDVKDFGKIMTEAMKEANGRADAKTVSEAVKKQLAVDG